jgi:hypothetical protein
VAYLSTVYSGRDAPLTLSQLTKSSYVDLDKQYGEFIASGGPIDLKNPRSPVPGGGPEVSHK